MIELSTGSLKRVEDMRTEDFLTSACENPNLELKDATVIKLALQSTKVIMITLRLNNEKVDTIFPLNNQFHSFYCFTCAFRRWFHCTSEMIKKKN